MSFKKVFTLASAGTVISLALSGCLSGGGGSSSYKAPGTTDPSDPGTPGSTFIALFNPDTGELPFPTNLAFLGTEDGTLNIPTDALADTALILAEQMNDLDGWSTVSPIEIQFASEVNPASLDGQIEVWRSTLTSMQTAGILQQALASFRSDGADAAIQLVNNAVAIGAHEPLGGHVVPVPGFTCNEPVTGNFEISVSATDSSVILLKPLTPLAAANEQDCLTDSGAFFSQVILLSNLDSMAFSNGHVVAVRDGLTSETGQPVIADRAYATLRSTPADELPVALAPLAAIYQPTFAILEGANIDPADTALAFSFSTQSISHALEHIADTAPPLPSAFQPGIPLSTAFQVHPGALIGAPYYLNNKPANIGSADNPTLAADAASVLSGQWTNASGQGVNRFDPVPVAEQTVNLPVMVTIPLGRPMPAGGWPVVIYQHGLTSNRGAVLGLAPLFAEEGWAMIAIDHPLHGILPTDDWGVFMDPVNERHFYIDMDGNGIDSSGAHATPLTSPATTRDVRRQTVADLLHLAASMPGMNVDGHRFDTEKVGYVGISMGGVIGSMFAGVAGDSVKAYSLNVPGGGMAKMFDGSPVFAAQARPALAAVGLESGSKAYEDFLNRGQTIEDSGDPINYARHVADGNASIYISEMVGNVDSNPVASPDLVLPNNLQNGPLYNLIYQTMELSDTQVAETAPLSGTTPLWQNMQLHPMTEGNAGEHPIRRVARLAGGSHYSLHMPTRPDMGAISVAFPDQHGEQAMEAVQRHTLQLLTTLGNELEASAADADLLVD